MGRRGDHSLRDRTCCPVASTRTPGCAMTSSMGNVIRFGSFQISLHFLARSIMRGKYRIHTCSGCIRKLRWMMSGGFDGSKIMPSWVWRSTKKREVSEIGPLKRRTGGREESKGVCVMAERYLCSANPNWNKKNFP